MRCKNCRRTTTQSVSRRANCWKKWQLCGQCAVKEHPDEFSEAKIKSWTKMPTTKEVPKLSKAYAWNLKRKPRMHTHCLKCNQSLEGTHYNTKYCSVACKKLHYYETSEGRKEYFKGWYQSKNRKKISEKHCKLCGRNIHEVNPNKRAVSSYCGSKCMSINSHMNVAKKSIGETSVRIPLQKYIDLLRDGHLGYFHGDELP